MGGSTNKFISLFESTKTVADRNRWVLGSNDILPCVMVSTNAARINAFVIDLTHLKCSRKRKKNTSMGLIHLPNLLVKVLIDN
jgi:hypothetical protein